MLGVVLLGWLAGQPVFTASDEKLAMALASQAAIAIEQAQLYQQEIKRQRLEQELELARQIQLGLLPASYPALPGWEFAAIYQAAVTANSGASAQEVCQAVLAAVKDFTGDTPASDDITLLVVKRQNNMALKQPVCL